LRLLIPLTLLLSLWMAWQPVDVLAQQKGLARRHHSWGRFAPGACKLVRIVTETLDEKGLVVGTKTEEMKTTLLRVDDKGVTLRVDLVVEVAGKRFEAEPQTVRRGFHSDLATENLKVKDLGPDHVTVEHRKIPCRIEQVEFTGTTGKTVTKTHYSDVVFPYVLRRSIVTTDSEGKQTLGRTTTEVATMNAGCRVLWEIEENAVQVKTVRKHPKGKITKSAFTVADVPGGVICHNAKEFDEKDRLIRRSSLQIIDYGLGPMYERGRLFYRPWPHRFRKPSRFFPR